MRYRISWEHVRTSDHFEQRRQERGIGRGEVKQLLADAYVSAGEDGAKLLTHPDSDLVVVYKAVSCRDPLPVLLTVYRAVGASPGGPRRSPRTCCWRRERRRHCAHIRAIAALDHDVSRLPRKPLQTKSNLQL
jgi:hypothetical protein